MNFSDRMTNCFAKCKAENRPAFIAYIAGGDPDYDTCLEIVDSLVESGVDILEIGLAFADPLADGPTNQDAAERALASGMNYINTFELIADIRKKHTELPLVLYTYINPIAHTADFTKNCQLAKASGVDAMLILDLPPGEGACYNTILTQEKIGRIALAAPTTADDRLPLIAASATEFIYYVSQVGVTGVRSEVALNIDENILKIKKYAKVPVVVGFGISEPHHVKSLASTGVVDGIVVGSAIVKRIAAIARGEATVAELGAFVKTMTAELK